MKGDECMIDKKLRKEQVNGRYDERGLACKIAKSISEVDGMKLQSVMGKGWNIVKLNEKIEFKHFKHLVFDILIEEKYERYSVDYDKGNYKEVIQFLLFLDRYSAKRAKKKKQIKKAASVSTPEKRKMKDKPLTEDELKKIAIDFLRKEFNMELYAPIVISSTLKSTFGIFRYNSLKKMPEEIKLSKCMIDYQPREVTIDVLKHELVHYALYERCEPFQDGTDNFENTLKRLGIKSSGYYTYKGKVHVYHCTNCENKISSRRKFNVDKYVCKHCDYPFKYRGSEILE